MTLTFVPPRADAKHIVHRDLTIAQLCLSLHNCRREEPSADNTAPLEQLILVQGLRHPIEVHQLRGSKTKWGAFAGRRRYYAILRLVERGDLPADWPVKVAEYIGYSDAELVELSLTENFRSDLKDHELYAGIARAHALGHDVETIARNLGNRDAQLVAQWLRLGKLAKPVFAALTDGEIDVARARAYAATEDHALQAATFEQLRRPRNLLHPGPTEIRRALKIGDRELERQLAFVGADAYRDAGGRYELDLFAEDEDQRGRVVDEGLLRELLAARLEDERAAIRERTDRPDLRFVADRPENGLGGTDWLLEAKATSGDDGELALPAGEIVAHIELTEEGAPELTFWWASRAAKFGTTPARPASPPARAAIGLGSGIREGSALSTSTGATTDVDPYAARRAANAQLRDEAGLTAELVEILRSQRRMILRARLIDTVDHPDGDANAVDFLVWSQLRAKLASGRQSEIGAAVPAGIGDPPETQAHLKAMPADAIWRRALYELQQQSFLTGPDLAHAFRDYCASDRRTKGLAAAVVAGLALERSLAADGYRIPVHDVLAEQLELDDDQLLRRYWRPTAELLDKLPKDARAAIAEPFVEAAVHAGWPRLPGAQLTNNVLLVVHGAGIDPPGHPAIRPALADQAANWVYPQLCFHAPAGDAADADQREESPAEPEAVA